MLGWGDSVMNGLATIGNDLIQAPSNYLAEYNKKQTLGQSVLNGLTSFGSSLIEGPSNFIQGYNKRQRGIDQIAKANRDFKNFAVFDGTSNLVSGLWNQYSGDNTMQAGAQMSANTGAKLLAGTAAAGLLINKLRKSNFWKKKKKVKGKDEKGTKEQVQQEPQLLDRILDQVQLIGEENKDQFDQHFGKVYAQGKKTVQQRRKKINFGDTAFMKSAKQKLDSVGDQLYVYGSSKAGQLFDIGMNYGKQMLHQKALDLKSNLLQKYDKGGKFAAFESRLNQKKPGIILNVEQKGTVTPRALDRINHKAELAIQNSLMKI